MMNKILESKFREYGLITELSGSYIVLLEEKQKDSRWKYRVDTLIYQLSHYFGIMLEVIENSSEKMVLLPTTSEIEIESDNPLLCPINENWRGLIPFDKIKLEHFLPAVVEAISVAKKVHEIILSCPDPPTFENTLGHGFDNLDLSPEPNLHWILSVFYIYEDLCNSPETFKLAQEIEDKVMEYQNSIRFDRRLYDRVQKIQVPDVESNRRAYDDAIYSGKTAGYDLSSEKQEALKSLGKRLSELTLEYRNNVSQATNNVLFISNSPLPGVPERALQNMRGEDGIYEVTLQDVIYQDILEYCTSREIREKVYKSKVTRSFGGKYDNRGNCVEIANIELEIAKMLGFSRVSDKILGNKRMIDSTSGVYDFLGSLVVPIREAAERDMRELGKFIEDMEGSNFISEPWDYPYYLRLMEESLFNIYQEKLRDYFYYPRILEGVFWLANKLFEIEFIKIQDAPVYEDGVEVYEAYQRIQDEVEYLGILYIDPFMRTNKRPGAYCSNLAPQYLLNILPDNIIMDVRPHVLIVTNFEKSGRLSFEDVTTLLHEFGHSLKEILSEVGNPSQSGNNVCWDYVELASQFMENFAYEPEFLKRFAKDDSGNSIPLEYIESIRAKSNFMNGFSYLRQLKFCYLDMAWFGREDFISGIEEVKIIEDESGKNIKLPGNVILPDLELGEDICRHYNSGCQSTAFNHIFSGGYTAGYYSYLNAEILAADAFSAFGENPIDNRFEAFKFEEFILSTGDTADPMDLYIKFRGSVPSVEAFLKQKGLI